MDGGKMGRLLFLVGNVFNRSRMQWVPHDEGPSFFFFFLVILSTLNFSEWTLGGYFFLKKIGT